MARIITRQEFESVADSVLQNHHYVKSYTFVKGGVRMMVYSRSRKSTWQATLYFCDDDGNYLDCCKVIEGAYQYANTASFVADDIKAALRR